MRLLLLDFLAEVVNIWWIICCFRFQYPGADLISLICWLVISVATLTVISFTALEDSGKSFNFFHYVLKIFAKILRHINITFFQIFSIWKCFFPTMCNFLGSHKSSSSNITLWFYPWANIFWILGAFHWRSRVTSFSGITLWIHW